MKKDTEVCDNIRKGHDVMTNILVSRTMKAKAALTLVNKPGMVDFITYIQKSNDDSFFVDMLPFVKKRIEEDEKTKQTNITLGACGELIPVLRRLLERKYESYQVVAIDFVRSVIKRWFKELREMSKNKKSSEQSMNLPMVYFGIVSLLDKINKLTERPGVVGNKATVVKDLFSQL